MIKYGLILLLAGVSWGGAAITTAPRKGEGNRFLFIVDTSSGMKRLDHSGRQVVFDLVYSGIEERMKPGDSFGLWTFDKAVKSGVFPMQTWSPEKSTDLASQVGRFLKEQEAARASYLDGAITNAERLVKTVRDVDIVIVTSASTRFKPDDTWAMLLQNWKGRVEEAKKSNKAMLVTLAGRGGQIRQATIALQGEALQLAAPPERKPTAPVAQAPTRQPPPKPTRDPIIMRGTQKATPIDEIPANFAPPTPEPRAIEPAANPIPEPAPVPVLGPDKRVVEALPPASVPAPATPPTPQVTPTPAAPTASQPQETKPLAAPEPKPALAPEGELIVSAREPGVSRQPGSVPAQTSAISPRMLIIGGATLMVVAGVLGVCVLFRFRGRSRVSYISRSLTTPPDQKVS